MDAHQVLDQMLEAGLDAPPLPLDLSGRLRRFGRKQASWYRLREERLDSGRYVVLGHFGCWRTGVSQRVHVDWRGIGDAERAELAAQRAARSAAEQAERARLAAQAQMSAAELWRSAAPQGQSAYLARKAVDAEACRFLPDGSIVVPLLRYDLPREAALQALQRIWPDGRKRFTRGFAKPGCSLRLGLVTLAEPILVCEGYATGLTLRMATARRLPVFVALDAGNLAPVCTLLRALYPACPLLICADDDWRTTGPDGKPLNVGRAKAHKVSRERERVSVTYPAFKPATRAAGDTDFNDLHCRDGLHEVARQLRWVLRHLSPTLFDPFVSAVESRAVA